MKDRLGREIEYLRVSVTQNCNLRCIYCKPGEAVSLSRNTTEGYGDHAECFHNLAPQEFEQIVKGMARLGIRRVRITGGEPLTRPDIVDIVSRIAGISEIDDLSMTTNGICLDKMAYSLKKAGLKRLNISLDSLKSEKFSYITGGAELKRVLDGIHTALEVGLTPVKINTVLIKGVNEDEVDDFIKLAIEYPVEVRFIELMPVGKFGEENTDKIVYNTEIIQAHPELERCKDVDDGQPAKYYHIKGSLGKVGFISPMSHKFCSSCNRIRLTCDGKIKPCLGNNGEVDITPILRNHPEKLEVALREIIYSKPAGHHFDTGFHSGRDMSAIGG